MVTFPKNDLGTRVDVRTIEGRQWHPEILAWSTPASFRTWKELTSYGFVPKDDETVRLGEYYEELTNGWHRLKSHGRQHTVANRDMWPFQVAGFDFLRMSQRALLYDEPGVGKTLQALAWLEDRNSFASVPPTTIIVAPKATLGQWADLLNDAKHDVVVRPSGTLTQGRSYVLNPEHLVKIGQAPDYTTVVVDEAHLFKNPKTQRSKALYSKVLSAKTSGVLAATGTPIDNKPIDMWGIYLMLGLRVPKQFFGFALTYCAAEKNEFGWDFSGASNLDKLRDDMLHWSLRRELQEVRPDMPDVTYLPMRVHVEGEQMDELDELDHTVLGMVGRRMSLDDFGEQQELSIKAAHAKTPAVIEWIANHLEEGGDPVVVACGYKEPLKAVVNHFNGVLYTGDQTENQREEAKSAFATGDVPVLGLTYGAGGTGLDGLQHVSHTLVELDIPWSPAAMDQAVGRLYRQGQKHPLTVVQPITNTRIERAKAWAQRTKRSVIECVNKGTAYGLDFES